MQVNTTSVFSRDIFAFARIYGFALSLPMPPFNIENPSFLSGARHDRLNTQHCEQDKTVKIWTGRCHDHDGQETRVLAR